LFVAGVLLVFGIVGPVDARASEGRAYLSVPHARISLTTFVHGELRTEERSIPHPPEWPFLLDGKRWRPDGELRRRVEPGRHTVELVSRCYEADTATVEVGEGEQATVDLTFVERTRPVIFQLELDVSAGSEVAIYTAFALSGRRYSGDRTYRWLGTVRSGESFDVPVCSDAIVAMNARIVARPIPRAAWEGGQVTLRAADVRRRDTFGDCFQQIAYSCRDDHDDSSSEQDTAPVECEVRPRHYEGYGLYDYFDLDDDGLEDKVLTFYNSGVRYHAGSIVLSGDGVHCARYAGPFATRQERAMETRHHGLRDLHQETIWDWIRVYEFDGRRYQWAKTVVCDDTHATEDDHYTPDAPECQGW